MAGFFDDFKTPSGDWNVAALSMPLMAFGLATGTVGSFYSAKLQRRNLETQANLAEINARIAEGTAQSALLAGKSEVASLTLRAGKLKAAQRVSFARRGVDLGTGSAAEVAASTEIMKEIDKNTLDANAVRAAWGYRTQATNFENEAIMKRAAARSISPVTAAATTLLEGAGAVAGKWYQMNKVGAFNSPSNEVKAANDSPDPIFSLGTARRWWSE